MKGMTLRNLFMYKVKVKGQGQTLKALYLWNHTSDRDNSSNTESYDPKEYLYVQKKGQRSRSNF